MLRFLGQYVPDLLYVRLPKLRILIGRKKTFKKHENVLNC